MMLFLLGASRGAWRVDALARFCGAAFVATSVLGLPSAARAEEDPYPLLAQVRDFAARPVSAETLTLVTHDFSTRARVIQRAGGAALARTDVGYGAHFRAHYTLRDGYVEEYSGEMDGWRSTWQFGARSLKDAIALAKKFEKATGNSLPVDFSHPTSHERWSATFQSKGDGCVSSYTFNLDASGRCTSIERFGAC